MALKNTIKLWGIAVFFLFSGFGVEPVSCQVLVYEGSSTIGENTMRKAAPKFKTREGIEFSAIGGLGSGRGFESAIAETADIGGVSRSLSAKEREQNPYYMIIGYDAVAIFVNRDNPVTNLSRQQIRDIFTGSIRNWREVGGHDEAIICVTEIKTGGRATIDEFKREALSGADFGETKEIDKPFDCVRHVAGDRRAVTFASVAFSVDGTKTVGIDGMAPTAQNVRSGAYPFSRPLILVSKHLPAGNVATFFDYIMSAEGQAIVREDFVPVR